MELTSFDEQCIKLLADAPNQMSKHCFRSAINHLNMAEKLFPIDSPMAVFRCITAEEEAASGLMHCLKERSYRNADRLDTRRHHLKVAFIPFFSMLCQFLEDNFSRHKTEYFLNVVNVGDDVRVTTQFRLPLNGEVTDVFPTPPLNIALVENGKPFSYREQIDAFLAKKGVPSMIDYLKEQANLRNHVLYASPKGYVSKIEVEQKFFPAYVSRVIALLRTYLLIYPYKEKQAFVQDCLDAFIAMATSQKVDHLHSEV